MNLFERKYQLELNKLKRLAASKDFTPEGSRRYQKQFERVKAAYEIVLREESYPTDKKADLL